ncbi:MAG: substrate-binding domain-containing protein [Anaerolineae bacterium]|nr:substrate-binding domain-containing protein [Anaerolineae bacterium]
MEAAGEATGGAALLGDETAACPSDAALTIYGSMPDLAFPFFVHMQAQGRDEAAAIGGVTYVETDGQSSVPKQTADVEAAIVQGAQALVISPLDVAAMAPALQQAVDAGVIVVTVDRRVEGVPGILNHVGADNVLGGEAQAQWVMSNYPDGARIFYLEGQPGSGPAIDRKAGFFSAIEAAGDAYTIVFEQTANFRRDEGLSVTEAGLAGLETPPDVIVAANDDMALGALEAINAAGLGDQVKIVGFDALPEALESIMNGGMDGTVEQFPGGQIRTALRVAVLQARGCDYSVANPVLLTPIVIDSANIDSAERIGEVAGG